ncbi:MAG: hypothetical protein PHP17_06650 [Candidatus Omnitrophica bacterium]|nr:hypothetical protein [Candidatus Omnitrophota bacterium]
MRNKVLCLCFISFLLLGNAFCETIILKSGKQVEGSIKERTSDSVKVDMEGVSITYYLTDIVSINGQKVAIENVTITEETKPQEPLNPEHFELTVEPQTPDTATTDEPVSGDTVKTTPPFRPGASSGAASSAVPAGITAGVIGGIILFALFFLLVVYVYSSICLQFIAKKTNSTPAFLAWIPFGHFFLRFKIAKMSYLWIFVPIGIIFISFVTGFSVGLLNALTGGSKTAVTANPLFMIVNFFLSAAYAAFAGYVWYKIALARNKKGWIGALMAISVLGNIPFVSIVVLIGCAVIMGYLAFSE